MKICFYTESYLVGGLDTFIIDLINNWPRKNDKLTVIFNESHTGLELYKKRLVNTNARIVLHSLPLVPEKQGKFRSRFGSGLIYKIYSVFIQYILFIYYVLFLYKKLSLAQYDKLMIINGGYPAGQSCRAMSIAWGINKGTKSIHNFHNFAVQPKSVITIIENIIDSLVSKYTKYFVSVSKTCSESLRNRPALALNTNIMYIYNGINDAVVNVKSSIIDEFQLDKDTLVCLILATYEARKGHDFLFNAFKKVSKECPNAILICCGSGISEDFERVYKLAVSLNLERKIYILEFRDDAMQLLAQADLLLISSQEFESFGLTAIEAMKYKIPVVSTNVGGLSEVILNNSGGYLFDRNDVDGYAFKVIELLKNKNIRLIQGELGYKRYCGNFRIQRVAQEYCDLIDKL